MEAIKQTFFEECEEQLAALETGLLSIDGGDFDPDVVDAVFRAVHSIKGGAGAFGLDRLVQFAHAFETALDALRSHRLAASPATLSVLLRAADLLADSVRDTQGRVAVDLGRGPALEIELAALTSAPAADPEWDALLNFEPVRVDVSDTAIWHVTFRPHASLYVGGNDSLVLLRELGRLGTAQASLDLSSVPGLADLDPEAAYLAWRVDLQTTQTENEIREVFEFVEGDCDLDVRPAAFAPLCLQSPSPLPARPEPAPLASAPVKQTEAIAARPTIRVDLDRLDRLIDLVGELVVNQAALNQRVTASGIVRSSPVRVGLDELGRLTREIQDGAMAIRARPVKAVFERLPRLAREVAAQTGKSVRLVIEGESTEVDNSIIERLSDPLTHMIRNAIDHGIEAPWQRVEAGKPAEGIVRVAARHRSGRIVVEVSDDGAGIDRRRVLASAVAKGIVPPAMPMSDEEIDDLIFAAGFSTAAAVSDISGRGVGMDVVRRSVQTLGGRISIASEPGRGSTFSLSLPLTLAVLDGMVVGVGKEQFVVPVGAILETFRLSAVAVHKLGGSGEVVLIRGGYVPLIDVGVALGFRRRPLDPSSAVALLVETGGGKRAALLVDEIYDQLQVVIKSLETNYRQIPGVAAATILGDGRIALILDVETIIVDPAPVHAGREAADA